MDKTQQLHLFIVWNKGLYKAGEILEDMSSRFSVLGLYTVHWSEEHFSNNLSRFYGRKLSKDAFMEAHCGRGPFLAAVILGESARCHEAKALYQSWTGQGQRVYASLTPGQTNRDLLLLLHQTSEEFLSTQPPWNGNLEEIQRDVLGASGWSDLGVLFRALNTSTEYSAIRNWENLSVLPSGNLDLDLLCADPEAAAILANAARVCPEPYRSLYKVNVAGVEMPVHFRSVDENYFDPKWSRDILQQRELSPDGCYHPSDEDYFYSLLYHAAIHQPRAGAYYRQRLLEMPFNANGAVLVAESFASPTRIRQVLDSFFKVRGYRFVEPNDLSVDLDFELAKLPRTDVERITAYSKNLGESLAALFAATEDCSTQSRAFQRPSFRSESAVRHFSTNRAMFIEALGLSRDASILQIGAESGVVTRWLGEHFTAVTALETDVDLLHCTSRRCRDLDNVRTVGASDKSFKAIRRFDVAVAILDEPQFNVGVALPPILRRAKEALKQSGLLLIGLDVQPNAAAVRNAVLQQLKSYGFNAASFFCAFPNVILPRVVFSTEAVREAKKSYGYWAAFALKNAGVAVPNELQFAGISAEGKLDELARACYIVASRDPNAMPRLEWQACAVSSEFRPVPFFSSTKVTGTGAALTVWKDGSPVESGVFRFDPREKRPLFEGHTAIAALTYALNNSDLPTFMSVLKSHANHLIREFAFCPASSYAPLLSAADTLLRGEALDAVLRNAVFLGDSYAVFDLEWQTSIPVPLSYVLFRGLKEFLIAFRTEHICKALRLTDDGAARQPSVPELCMFFIKSLGMFGEIKNEATAYIEAFESRLSQFMSTAHVPADTPSLFEQYHLAVALHTQRDYKGFRQVVAEMRQSHPDAPEPVEQMEEATV